MRERSTSGRRVRKKKVTEVLGPKSRRAREPTKGETTREEKCTSNYLSMMASQKRKTSIRRVDRGKVIKRRETEVTEASEAREEG